MAQSISERTPLVAAKKQATSLSIMAIGVVVAVVIVLGTVGIYTYVRLSQAEPPCDKCFAVLAQGPAWKPSFDVNGEQDVFWLTFKEPPPESNGFNAHLPGTTWTTGRNALLEMAMAKSEALQATGKSGYEYYVFVDDDVAGSFAAPQAKEGWRNYKQFIMRQRPTISYPHTISNIGPEAQGQEATENNPLVDGRFIVYHRSAIGIVLPYDDTFDGKSWWYSQTIADMMGNAWFGCAVGYNPTLSNEYVDAHSSYQGGLDAGHVDVDTMQAESQAQISGAFKQGTAAAQGTVNTLDVVFQAQRVKQCVAQANRDPVTFRMWRAPKAMLTPSWVAANMNPDNKYTQQRIDFMNRHPAWFPKASPFDMTACGAPTL